MPRKLLQRLLPAPHRLRQERSIRLLGDALHDPNLWHLNRHSAAGAVAVGLFCAFMPIPFQMLLAAALAVLLRVNLPIAVVLVWVTNPLTMAPIFLAVYRLGAWILHTPAPDLHFQASREWLSANLVTFWKPLLVGGMVVGTLAALTGWCAMQVFWRAYVLRRYRHRHRRRRRRQSG